MVALIAPIWGSVTSTQWFAHVGACASTNRLQLVQWKPYCCADKGGEGPLNGRYAATPTRHP